VGHGPANFNVIEPDTPLVEEIINFRKSRHSDIDETDSNEQEPIIEIKH
jgi:hypothetical protein